MTAKRKPRGVPTGGQFSSNEHDEAAPMEPVATVYGSGVDATIAALTEFSRIVGEAEDRAKARKKEKALERRRSLYAARKSLGTLPRRATKKDIEDQRIHDRADAEFHRQRYNDDEDWSAPR